MGSFLVLAVPAWHGFNVPITYDMLAELNPKRESVQGTRLLEKNFLIGKTGPITILAYRRGGNFDDPEQLARISALTEELTKFEYVDSQGNKTQPIREVSSLTNPLGEPLTKKKLRLWRKSGLSAGEVGVRTAILRKSENTFSPAARTRAKSRASIWYAITIPSRRRACACWGPSMTG